MQRRRHADGQLHLGQGSLVPQPDPGADFAARRVLTSHRILEVELTSEVDHRLEERLVFDSLQTRVTLSRTGTGNKKRDLRKR